MRDTTAAAATRGETRERVLVALAVIARPEMLARVAGISPDRVGFELCRLWFERVYVPGLWTVDGLKGNRQEAAVEAFWQAFDEDERAYLERFNRFVELRLEMTPEEIRSRGAIDPDRWAGIVRDAANTIALIAPDFEPRPAKISDVLRIPPASKHQTR